MNDTKVKWIISILGTKRATLTGTGKYCDKCDENLESCGIRDSLLDIASHGVTTAEALAILKQERPECWPIC